jgi:hypothetical protein
LEKEKFEAWMLIEIMGHKKLAGLVTEEERFDTVMLRIDIPTHIDFEEKATHYITQYYHHNAIFSATPINQTDALALAGIYRPNPFTKFDLHKEENVNLPFQCPHCEKMIPEELPY